MENIFYLNFTPRLNEYNKNMIPVFDNGTHVSMTNCFWYSIKKICGWTKEIWIPDWQFF